MVPLKRRHGRQGRRMDYTIWMISAAESILTVCFISLSDAQAMLLYAYDRTASAL